MAGSSLALGLLGGGLLLRAKNSVTDQIRPYLATEAEHNSEQLAQQRALQNIIADAQSFETGPSEPAAAAIDPNILGESSTPSARARPFARKVGQRHTKRRSATQPSPKAVMPEQELAGRQEELISELIKYLSEQIGGLHVEMRDASSRIAVTEDGIRQLREKSWYEWCGSVAALLGQLASVLTVALAILKWRKSKSAPPPVA